MRWPPSSSGTPATRRPAAGKAADPFKLPGWLRAPGRAALARRHRHAALQRRLDVAGNPRGWTTDRMLAVKGLGLVALGRARRPVRAAQPGAAHRGRRARRRCRLLPARPAAVQLGPEAAAARSRRDLPDALDMLTICVEAGLGFDAALAQVARNTNGPLAAEFARVAAGDADRQVAQPRHCGRWPTAPPCRSCGHSSPP